MRHVSMSTSALQSGNHPIVERFKHASEAGEGPRIEDYLASAAESEQPTLLHELLCVELANRRRSGEAPSLEEYRLRFPSHPELLANSFREASDRVHPNPGQTGASFRAP